MAPSLRKLRISSLAARAGSLAATAACLSACAVSPPLATDPGATRLFADAPSTLTEEERALDCKALTGRMKLRILQIRDYAEQSHPTGTALTVQKTLNALVGGESIGNNPDERFASDRAKLEAMNAELKRKGCRVYDLAEELKPKPATVSPTPLPKSQ